MSEFFHAKCPICEEQIKSPISQKHASEELAKHIVGMHTKRKNGQQTLQVPSGEPEPKRLIGQPNRNQRRAAIKAKRGSSQWKAQ